MTLEDEIIKAIEQFPTIKELVSLERLLEIGKKDKHSPIIYYLRKSLFDKSKVKKLFEDLKDNPGHIGILVLLDTHLSKYHIMKYLDNLLNNLKGEKKLNVFIEHLLDSTSFWQGYAEIEVASYAKNSFESIELEPKLPNDKYVDIKYSFNEEDYYAEVTVPKRLYKYEKEMEKSANLGIAVELPDSTDRACEKIIKEVEHYDSCFDLVNSVIIINLNESDFDEIEIEDCLLGISKLVILKDKETGKYIGTEVRREEWTGFDYDKRLENIGAIMCYKRNFTLGGDVVINKKIFIISFNEEQVTSLEKLFEQ